MLVIRRKEGESVLLSSPDLPKPIEVLIAEVENHRVKLGITAPDSVNIVRSELVPQQVEQIIPETFYKDDRERAKAGLSPLQLAYVERLEMAIRAADEYCEAMRGLAHSPAQYSLENNLLVQMSKVNFLSGHDYMQQNEEELPRDVIFH